MTNARDLPWRHTLDPYAVWVSEIMLQQTQVKTVIPYFERWMRELPTVQSLAKASVGKIHKLWEGLGYYTRVRNMQKAAHVIVEEHGGKFPTDFEPMLALPGVGRYTAGAICSIAFNTPAPILDGNVIRVLTRAFGIRKNVRERKTNAQLWSLAEQLVTVAMRPSLSPQRGEGLRVRGGGVERLSQSRNALVISTPHPCPLPFEGRGRIVTRSSEVANALQLSGPCSALNQALMELGATVCTPRAPQCPACPLARRCTARKFHIVESLPNMGKRPMTTERRFIAGVLEHRGALLVRQRAHGIVNAHLWEFPNVEVPIKSPANAARASLEAELGYTLESFSPFMTVKHSITRYRITLEAFRGEVNGDRPRVAAGKWVAKRKLEKLPFTVAHRRVLSAFLKNAGGG